MNHVSPSSDNSFLTTIKPHLGSLLTGFGSLCMAAVFAYGTFQHNTGSVETQSKDIERRVSVLENSAATRREVEALTANFNEYKLDSKGQFKEIKDLLRDIRNNRPQLQH